MREDEAYREDVFQQSIEYLQAVVNRHVLKGAVPRDLVATCIMVDDELWGTLAKALVPDHDWQPYRERGEEPYAKGVLARAAVADLFRDVVSELAKILDEGAPTGHVHALILGPGSFSVYELPHIMMGTTNE